MESARAQLASVKASTSDRFEVNRELILVREAESRLAACEAQIAADSVISLHHQLKAERDVKRREQLDELKKAQVNILFQLFLKLIFKKSRATNPSPSYLSFMSRRRRG